MSDPIIRRRPDKLKVMNLEHQARVADWNNFKTSLPAALQKIESLRIKLERGEIYYSPDHDGVKKSQITLALTEKPINSYRDKSGILKIETQFGCSLDYYLEYNGGVSSKITDYTGKLYKIKKYPSALEINERQIKNHIKKLFLVEINSSPTSQPSLSERAKFIFFSSAQQKSFAEITKEVIRYIPFASKILR